MQDESQHHHDLRDELTSFYYPLHIPTSQPFHLGKIHQAKVISRGFWHEH